jgi:hypothetical protein
MQVQLSRLFGSSSAEACKTDRSSTEWRRALKRVLHELDRYLAANVDTDELHQQMLYSGLSAADASLKDEDFWPGYVEGITRLALLLMGDYPDHRKRRTGRRGTDHYRLDRLRTQHWRQNHQQRLNTLLAAWQAGFPELSRNPREALNEFRQLYGLRAGYREFLEWYRMVVPADYATIFR